MEITQPALILQIKALFPSLTKAELQVATYITDNPDQVIHQSVSELAAMSDTSDATVIRTCKKLGFNSYQEFKVLLAQSIVSPTKTINGGIDDCASISDVVDNVFETSIQTLQLTRKIRQIPALEEAANQLLKASRIFIIGMGNAAAMALDLQHKLLRLGLTAFAQSDSHIQRIMITSLSEPGDVVFAISHSGSSKDIVDTARIAKENGATLISLTSMGRSPLSDMADIQLWTLSNETMYNMSAISSRFAQIAIIDALHTIISFQNVPSMVDRIQKVNKNMASLKC